MRILLVEDDQSTRVMLEKVLVAHDYIVELAEDGQSALAIAEQFDYDLMVLDIGIPALDGIGVCKRLRNQGCQVPILLLTAKDGATDRVMGLDAGADDYMVKPFNLSELLARIRALLRRGRTTVASIISWGHLHLDSQAKEMRYGEQILRFTPREYSILELFLLNPHRIFSRTALIDRLWEMEETPTEGAVSSHIKAIRQKLKASGATQDLIETMYGFGYRLRPVDVEPALRPERDTPTAPDFSAAAADAVMVELWERFKETFNQQIAVLDQVIAAGQAGQLTVELRQESRQIVHKLVGSLGVYGFPQGSVLARQLETVLGTDHPLEGAAMDQLVDLVTDLKQELCHAPRSSQSNLSPSRRTPPNRSVGPSDAASPLVLIVAGDRDWTGPLVAAAKVRPWSVQISTPHLEVAANRAIAQQVVDCTLPDVVMVDLTGGDDPSHPLAWLTELRQHHPALPILILTGPDNLRDRVAAARLGAQATLQKPMAFETLFQAVETALQKVAEQTAFVPATTAGHVMIVDDDPVILHRLSVILSPWGLEVTPLLDPNRFWDVLTHTAPDLLILDIEMPGFSGIELCQVVRNDPQWGNLPILFLTAHQEPEIIVQAFASGGDDYIRKPILEPELIARVLNRLQPGQIRRQQLMSTLLEQPQG